MIGDLHCGHLAGLTPPRYQSCDGTLWATSQREAWAWYADRLKQYRPFDLVICNGDAIAGKNPKNGGTQLLTSDRREQVKIALECLKETKAKRFRLTHGTPYHTGNSEDWEDTLCDNLKGEGYDAEIRDQLFLDVNGVIVNAKHEMGNSAQKRLRGTPLLSEGLYNDQWEGIQPRADVILRSHVHWGLHIEDGKRHWVAVPALCTLGDKFGARRCKGTVDFGFVVLDISGEGKVTVHSEKEMLASQPVTVETI